MKTAFQKARFLLILIPLALFIRVLDLEIMSGFLASNKTTDHVKYMALLVGVVAILLWVVLAFEKKSEE
ncbi:MAG: hypothetical protein ACON47_09035 [Flavobacteriaceae bacterium]